MISVRSVKSIDTLKTWTCVIAMLMVIDEHLIAQQTEYMPPGKTKCDRTIVIDILADAPVEDIFPLWVDEESTTMFMGEDTVIDPHPGGVYEIYFMPAEAEGWKENSTRGARLLEIIQNEKLVFEWTCPLLHPN